MSILGDEWRYADWTSSRGALSRGFDPDVGKYAIPVPLAAYQVLFELFGLDSHTPFRLMALGLLALVAALAYELLRRRVGYVLALPLVALILFLGTSTEVLATSLRTPAMMSLAASLGALLLLERVSLRRDAAACALLAIAVACHPGGLAFCAAAALIVIGGEAPSWRQRALRAWIFAVPLLFFLLFLRPAPDDRVNGPSFVDRAVEAPGYLADGVVGLLSRMAGVSEPDLLSLGGLGGSESPLGWVLAAGLAVAILAALVRRRPFPVVLLAFVTCSVILIGAALLAPGGTREPNLERYVLPASLAMLLAIAELLRGVELRTALDRPYGRIATGLGAALLAFAIASNATTLERRAGDFAATADRLRAEALAYELARDLDPLDDSEWDEHELQELAGQNRFPLPPGKYYAVAADYGSPAFTVEELAGESAEIREIVRLVLDYAARRPIPSDVRAGLR